MHEIQKHILKKLTLSPTARYSDLKPKSIEGNLFMYHLKSLIREDRVKNDHGKYRLTPKGKNFVDRVSFETFKERIQPKIVTLVVIKNKVGEYLLYRRRRSPFIGQVGFPYGKIHLAERIMAATQRELGEKTGLQAKLKHRGNIYLTVYDETELISHMLCHIFVGSNHSGELRTDTVIGECFWGKLDQLVKSETKLMPGVKQIDRLLKKSKGLFFEEYFLNTSD